MSIPTWISAAPVWIWYLLASAVLVPPLLLFWRALGTRIQFSTNTRMQIMLEVILVWLSTNLVIRLVVFLHDLGAHEIVLALVPILFMYIPVGICKARQVDSDRYLLALPAFRDGAWKRAINLNLMVVGIILLPYIIGYHVYYRVLYYFLEHPIWPIDWGDLVSFIASLPTGGGLPPDALLLVLYHFFFVAIPEEFFYRGYVQTRLAEVFTARWRIFGVSLGFGWLLTAVIFAFGHSLVQVRWWHFAIFFPALIFGWMRAKTNEIVAPAFFHAWCNITISFMDHLYGVIPPESVG